MFLPPDERRIFWNWEPPKPNHGKRQENVAITLIILVSALALFAPIAGGTIAEAVVALVRLRGGTG